MIVCPYIGSFISFVRTCVAFICDLFVRLFVSVSDCLCCVHLCTDLFACGLVGQIVCAYACVCACVIRECVVCLVMLLCVFVSWFANVCYFVVICLSSWLTFALGGIGVCVV